MPTISVLIHLCVMSQVSKVSSGPALQQIKNENPDITTNHIHVTIVVPPDLYTLEPTAFTMLLWHSLPVKNPVS